MIQKINIFAIAFLSGISPALLPGCGSRGSQPRDKTAEQSKDTAMKPTAFGWRKGVLTKRDGNWYLRSEDTGGNASGTEVRAFPGLAIDRITESAADDIGIRPFPSYPLEKYKRDGHPYPVDEVALWFGAFCENQEEYEEYATLMLTIKARLGEDPPGVMPVFGCVGFYIVTVN